MTRTNDAYAEDFLAQADRTIDFSFKPSFVLPGDDVTDNVTGLTTTLKIGPGLVQKENKVLSNAVGTLRYQAPTKYFVESSRKRYFPCVGDQVVGIIEDRGGDYYSVNIFSGSNCILSRLAFEGATKRNKPELNKGDVIYARIISTSSYTDTELSCTVTSGAKKEWSTGETVRSSICHYC